MTNQQVRINGNQITNPKNGQLNTQKDTKPIKTPKQQQLNAILTDKYNNKQKDLYAAIRPERPPDVATTTPYPNSRPTNKEKGKQVAKPIITRKVTTRSHIEEVKNSTPVQQTQSTRTEAMDTDLPIQDKINSRLNKPRTRRIEPDIKYDIVSDVLKQKADIEIGDLITVAPSLRKKLVEECRPKRKPRQERNKQATQQTMALIEDEEINTTAAYSTVSIGDKNIKALVDSGASKTCMSKALADALELEIDSASENIFTLGNGTKQPALGLIYDVPIEVKEDMVIPCTIEVLPSCPSHLILGSNWLNRAKAKIDFNSSSLKVKYKNQKAELPIHFIRKSTPLPKMKTFHQDYQHPISLTNSHSDKHVHFEDSDSEGSYSSTEEESESESEETSDDDIEMEVTTLERSYEQESLQVLENDKYEEVVITNSQEMYSIKSTDTGLLNLVKKLEYWKLMI
ncbi:hypothetical protein G6F19_012791 [Rhizopus arrhizus]|nr:hypothetical protein G6F19_012791 [Rhizopus arrhizus]